MAGDEDERRKGEIEKMFAEFAPKFPGAPTITAEELVRDMAGTGALVIVDVRTREEQDVSMIRSAIRREDFEELKSEFKGHKVVAYCTIGYRSGQYVEKLRAEKFDAYNLKGSILSWTHAGGELERGSGDGEQVIKRVHTYGKNWDLASREYEAVYHEKPALAYVAGLVPDALKPWTWFKKK